MYYVKSNYQPSQVMFSDNPGRLPADVFMQLKARLGLKANRLTEKITNIHRHILKLNDNAAGD